MTGPRWMTRLFGPDWIVIAVFALADAVLWTAKLEGLLP